MTATDVDYEAEYNNRARVPEHPQIFERWRAAATAFRDEMTAQGRAELAVPYGATPRQIIDFFLAEPDSGRLAVFVHGGYWRSLEPETFSHLARGLVTHGISVAGAGSASACSCTAIPPAGTWPPARSRPTGKHTACRITPCRPPARSRACSI